MGNVGRPRKLELRTYEKAIDALREFLIEKYKGDMTIVERKMKKKKTLQNMVSGKKLTNHGDRRCPLLDLNEVFSKCG